MLYTFIHAGIFGESGSVDLAAAGEWMQTIDSLIAGYAAKDVFNADEFALFYKCLPSKTLTLEGEKCSGGKHSKERVTILAGANMVRPLE